MTPATLALIEIGINVVSQIAAFVERNREAERDLTPEEVGKLGDLRRQTERLYALTMTRAGTPVDVSSPGIRPG